MARKESNTGSSKIKTTTGAGKSASARDFKPEDDFVDDGVVAANIVLPSAPKKRGRKSKAELAALAAAQTVAVVEADEPVDSTPIDDTEGWPEPEQALTDEDFQSAEDAIAARDEADAAAAEGEEVDELTELVNEVNAEDAEVEALMSAVEEQPGLSAQQRDEVTKLQATTLVFELYIKRTGFKRSVSADEIIKGDLDKPRAELTEAEVAEAVDAVNPDLTDTEKAAQRRKLIKVRKRILECDELDAIDQTARDFKSWLQNRRVPCSILRGGRFVIPTAYVSEVENRFQEFKALRRRAVKAFLLVYDQRITEAEATFTAAGVGTLFRRADFPVKEELARAYQVQREWRAFDAPKALQTIKAALWTDAQAQIEIQLAGVADEAKDALRETFAGYIGWMTDRLTQEEGQTKKKAINENKVAQMIEFLSSVDKLNIGGDADLAQLTSQARDIISGVDLKSLKKDDGVRETIRASFEKLQTATAAWIVEKDRVICFDADAV